VLAGGGGRTILLSTGLAAAITESISMGAVGYTSTVADRDYYTAQRTEEESALVDDADPAVSRSDSAIGALAAVEAGGLRSRSVTAAMAAGSWLASALTTNVHRFDHAALGLGRPQR
jgi:hypothetical protein